MGDWFGVDLTDYDLGDDYVRPTPVDHWSELLFQSTWWHDRDGSVWRLDELDAMRCTRILGFITSHETETGTRLVWEATNGPEPSGDVASDAYDRGLSELVDLVNRRGWIGRTDLAGALRRRMRGLPAVEGTCFCGYPVEEGWDHSACRAGMETA
ncbi:hypothetical protein ACWDXD_24920 [Streptomyces sp. NPDC003314]